MPAPVFLGDEVSAAAYRLAGARTRVPPPEEMSAAFQWACSESELVLITADFARYLPSEELARVQMQGEPLVLLVPDVCARTPVPDLAKQLRGRLGVEA